MKFHRTKYDYLVDFDVIDTEFKAYFLGLSAADGNMCRREESVFYRITLQERDKELLEKIRDIICPDYKLGLGKPKNPRHQTHYTFRLHGSAVCDALEKHGIVPKKTFILKPPKNLSLHLIRHWIRGYTDGDGHVIKMGDRLVVGVAGTFDVLQFISDAIRRDLGFATTVRPSSAHKRQSAPHITYSLGVWSNKAKLVLHYLYEGATIYMERKKEVANEFLCQPKPTNIQFKWDEQMIELLKEYYPILPAEEITKMFPYASPQAIQIMANRCGVVKKERELKSDVYWTEEEDSLLRQIYSQYKKNELINYFNRSVQSIQSRAKTLKLLKSKKNN